MPRGPNSSKAKVRSGRWVSAYSIRSSLVSKSGSLDSFHVLVRWKVIPRRVSRQRSASRPICMGRVTLRRRWSTSLRIDHRVKGLPSLVGRVVAVWMTKSSSSSRSRRGRPPAHSWRSRPAFCGIRVCQAARHAVRGRPTEGSRSAWVAPAGWSRVRYRRLRARVADHAGCHHPDDQTHHPPDFPPHGPAALPRARTGLIIMALPTSRAASPRPGRPADGGLPRRSVTGRSLSRCRGRGGSRRCPQWCPRWDALAIRGASPPWCLWRRDPGRAGV